MLRRCFPNGLLTPVEKWTLLCASLQSSWAAGEAGLIPHESTNHAKESSQDKETGTIVVPEIARRPIPRFLVMAAASQGALQLLGGEFVGGLHGKLITGLRTMIWSVHFELLPFRK